MQLSNLAKISLIQDRSFGAAFAKTYALRGAEPADGGNVMSPGSNWRRRPSMLITALVGALVAGSVAPVPSAFGGWSKITPPHMTKGAELTSVTATSDGQVWAVGAWRNRFGVDRALILRRTASGWRRVVAANPGSPRVTQNILYAVRAVSNTNVWAAGGSGPVSGVADHGLIEHWDGKRWTVVDSPAEPSGALRGLCRVAGTTRMWAVGTNRDVTQGVVERWNGRTWREVRFAGAAALSCVAAPQNLWVVGESAIQHLRRSHWSGLGTEWNMDAVASPEPTPRTLWVVGKGALVTSFVNNPLSVVFRADPLAVISPQQLVRNGFSPGNVGNLTGVVARPNDVWAVGIAPTRYSPIIAHSDGATWTPVTGLVKPAALLGITRVPRADTLWAVGWTHNNRRDPYRVAVGAHILIMRGP
jgi:hypothetical protein